VSIHAPAVRRLTTPLVSTLSTWGARGDPRWAIAVLVAHSSMRWAVIWGTVFGLYVIATVRAYMAAYPSLASRVALAHSLQSFSMLLGIPRHAETVAGFTS
jgi:hypothetical protein